MDIKASRNSVQKSKEGKTTHFYCHDKYIKEIPRITHPRDLLVFYLHNNEIFEITNLEDTKNLVSLYLQHNRILKIENLGNLKKLKKLYLGNNTISVVEGLENLESLEELQLQKQYLFEGNSLCFDPRSIFNIANSLQILNISHNKIQTISYLAPLKYLKELNASYNDIADINEVCQIVKSWFYIKDLSFTNNPITKDRLYKENIIATVHCLETLDKKVVSDNTRRFLKKLNAGRIAQTLQKVEKLTDRIPDIAKNYPIPVQKAVSLSVFKKSKELIGDDVEIFDERKAIFIPWKTLPKPQSVSNLEVLKEKQRNKRSRSTITNNAHSNLKI